MVPGERGVDRHARRGAVRRPGEQEVVRVGERGERRGTQRVGRRHVQQPLLGRIGHELHDGLVLPGVRVRRRGTSDRALERPRGRRVGGRPAVEVEVRRRVGVHLERRGRLLLGGEQAADVRVDLAE